MHFRQHYYLYFWQVFLRTNRLVKFMTLWHSANSCYCFLCCFVFFFRVYSVIRQTYLGVWIYKTFVWQWWFHFGKWTRYSKYLFLLLLFFEDVTNVLKRYMFRKCMNRLTLTSSSLCFSRWMPISNEEKWFSSIHKTLKCWLSVKIVCARIKFTSNSTQCRLYWLICGAKGKNLIFY